MNPCQFHEIYKFCRPLGRHYFILSLSDLCLGVKRKIFYEVMHFQYMTCMATPLLKNLSTGCHEIDNFGRPFLCHYYYTFSLSILFRIFIKQSYPSKKSCLFLRAGINNFRLNATLVYKCGNL